MSDVILANRPVELFSDEGREVIRRSVHRVRDVDNGQVGRVRVLGEWRKVFRPKGKRTWELDD
jgi:hypothetical protein